MVCILTYFQCAIYTCEAMERDKLKLSEQYFTQLASKHTEALDSLLAASLPDQAVLLKLTGNSAVFSFRIYIYHIMGYFRVAKFLRFCLKTWGLFFADFTFCGLQRLQKIISIRVGGTTRLSLAISTVLKERKSPAKVSETQGTKRYLQSDRHTNKKNIFTFRPLNEMSVQNKTMKCLSCLLVT